MDMSFIELAKQFIGDYWPHVSGVLVPAVATAIFAHLRRPKSTARDTGPYFTEAELLTPPLVRPAYSDRMAYVLAEMSDLAYYQFEGEGGFIEDAVQAALERNLTDGQGHPPVPGSVLHGADERPAPEPGRVRECSRELRILPGGRHQHQGNPGVRLQAERRGRTAVPRARLSRNGEEDFRLADRCAMHTGGRGKDQGPLRLPGRVHEERRCRGKNGRGTGPGDTRSAGGQG